VRNFMFLQGRFMMQLYEVVKSKSNVLKKVGRPKTEERGWKSEDKSRRLNAMNWKSALAKSKPCKGNRGRLLAGRQAPEWLCVDWKKHHFLTLKVRILESDANGQDFKPDNMKLQPVCFVLLFKGGGRGTRSEDLMHFHRSFKIPLNPSRHCRRDRHFF
jgi:hypothetical protein